jgi:hypothetical protein
MALTDYKAAFDNSYQEIFQKTLVAKDIMNTRFEPMLTYGGSVTRVAMDLSSVLVRTVTRGSASTIDAITDTAESLTINLEKETAFHLSDGEVTQTGPLKAMQFAGKELAHKLALDLDGRCFAEVLNASYSFDAGDLTTGTSSGTPITLSATTVPQMTTRLGAKLRNKNNQEVMTNMALVVDSYAASDISQFIISKNIDLAGAVFKNGYVGDVGSAQMYVSENLSSTSVLGLATNPTDGDTITIAGVTIPFLATLAATAGAVHIASTADITRANLAEHINNPADTEAEATDTGYVAFSAANQLIMAKYAATNDNTANTLTVVGTGTGRTLVSETLTDGTDTWTLNYINAYYGKKGAIDLVIQDSKEVDVRPTADRRGNNIFSSYLAGIKTFADGAKKFLNVKILVA